MSADNLSPEQVAVLDELPHREPYLSFRRIVISQARRIAELERKVKIYQSKVVPALNDVIMELQQSSETTATQENSDWQCVNCGKHWISSTGGECCTCGGELERVDVPPPIETSAVLKECPYCKKQANSEGAIFHKGECAALEDVVLGRLEYDALIARQPQPPVAAHPDDLAVDRFAAAMKAKLAKKRAEGRGGWDDPTKCTVGFLENLLREHVDKGDPIDIGNFAMMLYNRYKQWDSLHLPLASVEPSCDKP